MDNIINEKSINKRFNAKESNYKTSAPIIGNSLESRIFASRYNINKIKDLLTSSNIDLSSLNEEYMKSFNELCTQYNSMNEELKDIIEDFKNNIEYKKFSAEDSPFIFDKEFFKTWDLSKDKTKFTLTKLTNEFLNKEIEFEFKVKNIGFYCQENITNYINYQNINYTIKYYIDDEKVSTFVKEYKKEDYGEEIKFKVVFLISSIYSVNNYINIDYNFFKQFATTSNDSKFYLTFNKLTDFFDINIPEEDQNVLSYSDENKRIIFKSGHEDKTNEGIEDVIEEKDENIDINGNRIYSSYNSSALVQKTMNLQSNIDDEKIIGIEKHPLDESEEVVDGIEIKGNENNEDIVLTIKDRIINTHFSFINMPNHVDKIENFLVKNENIGNEEYKMIELNTPRMNKLSFNYSKEKQNSEIVENEIEKYSILVFSDDIKIFEDIIDKDKGVFEYEFETIKERNIKIYVSNKKDDININISDIKYASNNSVEIEYENKKILIDEELNELTIRDLVNNIQNNFSFTNNEYNKINEINSFLNSKDSLLNLQFPIERPAILEELTYDDKRRIFEFMYYSIYLNLLTEDEKNIVYSKGDPYYDSILADESVIYLYNKYEINEDMFAEKENEYREYLINLYRKYAGDREYADNGNIIQKFKSNDITISDLKSLNVDKLLNEISNLDTGSFNSDERNNISKITSFINNKKSLMSIQFPVERPIGNKLIRGGRVYVFK